MPEGNGPSHGLHASVAALRSGLCPGCTFTPTNGETPLNAELQVTVAEIQVGGERVQYRRAGTGAPVLFLQGPHPVQVQEAVGEDVFLALARRHRVFQPTTPIPRNRDDTEKWLQGVVEGLGLMTPEVVADPELAPALARLVSQNGGFVGRVIFLVGQGTR